MKTTSDDPLILADNQMFHTCDVSSAMSINCQCIGLSQNGPTSLAEVLNNNYTQLYLQLQL